MIADDYDFVKIIGKGKYGEVWQVIQKTSKKLFAVKKVELLGQTEEEQGTLRREAELLSNLSHPNIVAFHGVFEVEGSHLCIVMNYCDGGDLHTRLQQQEGELFQENQVMEWFIQVCMAIQYLHDQHILHRDLKTQNIFLTHTKFVKLGDFGIARALQNGCDMAETFIGTPYYMSPELFANKPYNSKTDMWSLGCCLHEMMTLKYAFTASSLPALMKIIAKGQIPALPKEYSKELMVLCKQLLNPKPSQRPSANKVLKMPFVVSHIQRFCRENRNSSNENKETVAIETEKNNEVRGQHVQEAAGVAMDGSMERRQEFPKDENPLPRNDGGSRTNLTGDINLRVEDTCTKVKPTRKKKRFLKDRALACSPEGKGAPQTRPPPVKPRSKQPIKPRPLPIPPISALGEPVHRKEFQRVSRVMTDLLSDSSCGSQRQGSSTSASSLEEQHFDAEDGGLTTARSSINCKARRKRREKNLMAVSSSIEMIRLQGVPGTVRESPPQTLQASGPQIIPSFSVTYDSDETRHSHPAFRNEDKKIMDKEMKMSSDMASVIGLFNENLISENGNAAPVNGSKYQIHLATNHGDGRTSYNNVAKNKNDWSEDEPPDIQKRKRAQYLALKDDCTNAIGPTMLDEACQILESESEETWQVKLMCLLGPHIYEEYALKIWQLNFLKGNMNSVLQFCDFADDL